MNIKLDLVEKKILKRLKESPSPLIDFYIWINICESGFIVSIIDFNVALNSLLEKNMIRIENVKTEKIKNSFCFITESGKEYLLK